MEKVTKPLAWEINRYDPDIFFSLEASSTTLRHKYSSDLSYFYFFLEEMFGNTVSQSEKALYT
jgi:hypothetical protein